jgi:hypothetical protein
MLVLIVIGLAVLAGFVAGGSLRPFEHLRLHWWGAALAGLMLQGIPLTNDIGRPTGSAVVVASYGLLVAFAWVNRRLPALWLVIPGLVLNLLVIGTNGGMPVSAGALEAAGAGAEGLVDAETVKHHLMGPADTLTPLADVIGIPPPVGAVVSVGDLFLYAGVAALVVTVMLGRSGENRRPPPRLFQGYRGKHLPPGRRFVRLMARPDAPVAAGAPSGISP